MHQQGLRRAGQDAALAVTLLPGEPAGKIITRTAGAIEIRANMQGQPGQPPQGSALPSYTEKEYVRCSFVEEIDEEAASLTITGEIRAFSDLDLRQTVDSVLREISAASALSEAVLEACAVRLAMPVVAPAGVMETLARDLLNSGFSVGFGRSWSLAPNAQAALGTYGAEQDLTAFFREHYAWEIFS